MNTSKLLCCALLSLGTSSLATLDAQEPPKTGTSLQITSAISADFASGGVHSGGSSSLGFLQDVGRLRFSEATLSIRGERERAGFQLDGGYGDFYRYAMAGDSWKGPNQYLSQGYIWFKPFSELPIRVEAGKFFTSVGAEVPQSYQDADYNASRSLLFWYASPLYHVGVRTTVQATKSLVFGAQLLSGSNTVTGAHGHQSMAFSQAWTGKHFGVTHIYLGGNQKAEGRGWRQLSDTVVNINATKKLTGYVEALGALEKRVDGGNDRWYGAATSWRFAPSKTWAFSPRLEWYNDATGATTGTPQHLSEFTFTAEYKPVKYAVLRMEFRNDGSDKPFYATSPNGDHASSRQTLIAGVTFLLSHEMALNPRK